MGNQPWRSGENECDGLQSGLVSLVGRLVNSISRFLPWTPHSILAFAQEAAPYQAGASLSMHTSILIIIYKFISIRMGLSSVCNATS